MNRLKKRTPQNSILEIAGSLINGATGFLTGQSNSVMSGRGTLLRAFLGSSLSAISNIGVDAPASMVAEVQMEQPEDPTVGARRKKIRYGPYRLPAHSVSHSTECTKRRRLKLKFRGRTALNIDCWGVDPRTRLNSVSENPAKMATA
jgi:hypothetical protein